MIAHERQTDFRGSNLRHAYTRANTDARVRQYLASGVSMVWIIDPWLRTVIVYRPRAHSMILEEPDTLSGDPVIPGFAIPVAALFT